MKQPVMYGNHLTALESLVALRDELDVAIARARMDHPQDAADVDPWRSLVLVQLRDVDPALIRRWARDEGLAVPKAGRLSDLTAYAFAAAHRPAPDQEKG